MASSLWRSLKEPRYSWPVVHCQWHAASAYLRYSLRIHLPLACSGCVFGLAWCGSIHRWCSKEYASYCCDILGSSMLALLFGLSTGLLLLTTVSIPMIYLWFPQSFSTCIAAPAHKDQSFYHTMWSFQYETLTNGLALPSLGGDSCGSALLCALKFEHSFLYSFCLLAISPYFPWSAQFLPMAVTSWSGWLFQSMIFAGFLNQDLLVYPIRLTRKQSSPFILRSTP